MKQMISNTVQIRFAFSLLVLIIALCAGCGVTIYSDKDEVDLGQKLDQEIRSNPKEYPILQGHPEVRVYLSTITQKILKSPDVKKKNVYPYKIEIIADDKTINAFCTPGGFIYVYTGLLKYLDNEATLAGVLAHEIAHAELRHATKRITAAYGVQILLGVALGKNPSTLTQIAANLFTNLGFLKNSRDDEIQADNSSMQYLRATEYYPGAIKYFFDKIEASGKSGRPSSLEKLFLTHPPSKERADNVDKRMRELSIPTPSEASIFSKQYQDFKKKLP